MPKSFHNRNCSQYPNEGGVGLLEVNNAQTSRHHRARILVITILDQMTKLDDQLKIFLCYFIFIFPMACGFNAHYNSHILLLAQNLSMRVHTNRGNMFSRSENSVVSLKLDFGIRTAGYLKNVICSVCSLETNYCFCS